MTQMRWNDVMPLLRHPHCQGSGPLQLVAKEPFWDEGGLPFELLGGASILHILPEDGFRKESLASSPDERLLIVDCPDDDGWLVPEEIVAEWMNRHITNPRLEDILVSHPLYEYLTRLDEDGHSRGGGRGDLVQWAPGEPHLASLYAPEFLPGDPDAPAVNTDRGAYADAVADLLSSLEAAFPLREVEIGIRFGDDPPAWQDDDLAEGEERLLAGTR